MVNLDNITDFINTNQSVIIGIIAIILVLIIIYFIIKGIKKKLGPNVSEKKVLQKEESYKSLNPQGMLPFYMDNNYC